MQSTARSVVLGILQRTGTTCSGIACAQRAHAVRTGHDHSFGVFAARRKSSSARNQGPNATESGSPQPSESSAPKPSESTPNKSKPRRPHHPQVRLIGRRSGVANITPDPSRLRVHTIFPANAFSRPHYLTTEQARIIPTHAFTKSEPDAYIRMRCVELYGAPGRTDWVAQLNVKIASGVVHERVNDCLSRLEWTKPHTRALKDVAWLEHMVAMQNPRLEGELDEHEQSSVKADAPPWPAEPGSSPHLGLSWSTSSERAEPRPLAYRPPAYLLGNHNFPRPKRILRLRPYDKSLLLVFASPNARKSILAAYAGWIRSELTTAYEYGEKGNEELDGAPWRGAWPPIGPDELGDLPKGGDEYRQAYAAIAWADESGWRPAFRIRPFGGIRKWGDDWHPKGKWSAAKPAESEEVNDGT